MPDVGVLSLQIHDHSEQAEAGLNKIVDALERIKGAINSSGLRQTASALDRISRAININTVVNLNGVASALQKIKAACDFTIPNLSGLNKVKTVLDSVSRGSGTVNDSISGINTGFDTIGQRAVDAKSHIDEFNSSMRETMELMQNTSWTSGFDQFFQMFKQMASLQSMFTLGAGAQTALSTNVENGWTSWKEGAIEVEGTVTDAVETMNARLGEPIQYLTGMTIQLGSMNDYLEHAGDLTEDLARKAAGLGSNNNAIILVADAAKRNAEEEHKFAELLERRAEEAKIAEQIRAQQEAAFYNSSKTYSMDETNSMADNLTQLDLLEARLRDAEVTYNKFVNELGAGDAKTIKAGLAVSDLRDKIWEYKNALDSVTDSQEETGSSSFSLATAWAGLKDGIQKMFPSLSKLIKQFMHMAKMRALRYIIRQIAAGLKEGVQNLYEYSKAAGTSFAPSMDSAASSILQMKNSLGAALAPVLQSLIPVLQTIIDGFITVVNWVNQFFALLRGQSTWTRALPATTTAFGKQETAARKAGSAIKDLLADWDELNIIQSESSGGGGSGGATKAAEDYLNMFEEVGTFNNDVKKVVDFIEDHLGGLKKLIGEIGLAIAAWKLSRAFEGQLGNIARIAAGVIVSLIGVQIAYGAGYEAGLKGYIDKEDVLTAIGGILATGLGGWLIGTAIPIPGAGFVGLGLGLMAGVASTLLGYVKGAEYREAASKWGDVQLTADEIKKKAEDMFSFDIAAEIEVFKVSIENYNQAKEKVGQAVRFFSQSLAKAKISYQIGSEDAETDIQDAYAKSKELIDAVNARIQQNEDMFAITMQSVTFKNKEGKDISEDLLKEIRIHDTSLQDYFTNLGKKIADWIYKGEQSGWANGEMEQAIKLMESQERIVKNAENMQSEVEYTLKVKGIIDRADLANLNYESAQGLIKQIQEETDTYRNEIRKQIEDERENAVWSASLAQSIVDEARAELAELEKNGAASGSEADVKAWKDRINELKEVITEQEGNVNFYRDLAAKYFDPELFEEEVEKRLEQSQRGIKEKWTSALLSVYGTDFSNIINDATKKTDGKNILGQDILTAFAEDIDWNMRHGGKGKVAESVNSFIEGLFQRVDPNGVIQSAMQQFGISVWDLLNDDMKQTLISNMIDIIGDTDDVFDIISSAFHPKTMNFEWFQTDKQNNPLNQIAEDGRNATNEINQLTDGAKEAKDALEDLGGVDLKKDEIDENWAKDHSMKFTLTAHDALGLSYQAHVGAELDEELRKRQLAIKEKLLEPDYDNTGEKNNPLSWLDFLGLGYKAPTPAEMRSNKVNIENPVIENTKGAVGGTNDFVLGIKFATEETDAFKEALGLNEQNEFEVGIKFVNDATDQFNYIVEEITNSSLGQEIKDKLYDLLDKTSDSMMQELYNNVVQNGVDDYTLSDWETYFNEGKWSSGKTPVPIGMLASAGMTSGVRYAGAKSYDNETVVPGLFGQSGAQAETTIANGVKDGMKSGNETQVDLLRQAVNYLMRLANKEFKVNITPTSSWGQHNTKSQEAYARMTGNQP